MRKLSSLFILCSMLLNCVNVYAVDAKKIAENNNAKASAIMMPAVDLSLNGFSRKAVVTDQKTKHADDKKELSSSDVFKPKKAQNDNDSGMYGNTQRGKCPIDKDK